MYKKRLFLVIISFFLFSLSVAFTSGAFTNTCTIVPGITGCSAFSGSQGVVSFFFEPSHDRKPDAHVYNYTTGDPTLLYHLCCSYNGTAPYLTTGYCSHGPLFTMWSLTNSHIAQNKSSGATYRVCATPYDNFGYCEYKSSPATCNANQTLIGSIDPIFRWNSHYGISSTFDVNICCSFNTTIILQGINIAQFEYWCGVTDGVCPEDYRNLTGGAPVCYPREDPDC